MRCLGLAQDPKSSGEQPAVEFKDVSLHVFDPARSAADDIQRAVAEGRKTGKRVLIDVGGEWCPWCQALDRFWQSNPELSQFRDDNFIMVAVYYGSSQKNEKVLSRYSTVQGIPHFFILDQAGTLVHSQRVLELQTAAGYSPEKVKEFLARWSSPRTGPVAKTNSRADQQP